MWKKLLITLGIGGVCGYLAIHGVNFHELSARLSTVSWGYFALALPPMLLTHVFRTLRWQVLVAPQKRVGFGRLFAINAVGFMMVNLLPFRLGELVRPLLLSQRESLPYPSVLATSALERVFDGLSVLIILFIGVVIAPLPASQIPYVGWDIAWMVRAAIVLFVPVLIALVAVIVLQERALRLFGALCRWLPPKVQTALLTALRNFIIGLHALKGARMTLLVALYSLLTWVAIVCMTHFTLLAFNLGLPFYASFTVLGIICLGIMIPGPPGFAGTYELFCKGALALFAVEPAAALGFALASHAFNIFFMLLCGLICLPFSPVNFEQLFMFKRQGNTVDAKANVV